MRVFVALMILSLSAFAQDMRAARVEAFFREQAKVVQTPELDAVLAAGQIVVVKGELKDNGGSLVDALGEPGKITLSEDRWMSFLREGRDVRLLVLHELLRMAGLNDDNYLMSRHMIPLIQMPVEARPYCDLRVASTKTEVRSKRMTGEGYGRPAGASGQADLSGGNLRLAQENAVLDMTEKCRAKGFVDGVTVQGSYSTVSRNNRNGFIRHEMKVVVEGTCTKKISVQRPKTQQKAEGCKKVLLCRSLLDEGAIAPLQTEDAQELEATSETWRCL